MLCCFGMRNASWAQQTDGMQKEIANVDEVFIRYTRAQMMGGFLSSNGFGLTYRKAKMKTVWNMPFWEAQMSYLRHPKEVRTVNRFYDRSGSFIFGKLNSVVEMRAGIGQMRTINLKADLGSVEVGHVWSAGMSLAILKPVYLNIVQPESTFQRVIVNPERYDPNIHFPDQIYSRSFFTRGLDEAFIVPGLYLTQGLMAEWAGAANRIKVLELGVMGTFYPRPLPMMAFNQNQSIFVSLFAKLLFGKRWNP